MAYRCPTAKVVGCSTLNGYRLLFRGNTAHAVATIERQKGGVVPVLVWDIQPADEVALDRYEGWPHLYRREMLSVCVNGEQVEAMVYIMNDGRSLGVPSRAYFTTILQGYLSAEFEIEMLNYAAQESFRSQ